jgi:endonuclease/exonuclease/phosphatase family metal-dependent hydrolase
MFSDQHPDSSSPSPRPPVNSVRENPAQDQHEHARKKWAISLVASATLTVLLIYGINRFVHDQYVTFSVPRRSLRVLSWNIGRIHLRWDSRAADSDLDYVAEVIREVNPHIVALQEIRNPRQLGQLVTKLGSRWRASTPEDNYDRRAALLMRLDGRFYALPTSSGRTAQGAIIRVPGRREITVVSLHLDAFDAKRRLQQAEEIAAGARRLGNRDILLAGDFNCDPARATGDSADQRLHSFLSGGFVDAAKDSGSTTLGAQRLDYVFFSRESAQVYDAKVLRTRRIGGMDHYPLVVELGLLSRDRSAGR